MLQLSLIPVKISVINKGFNKSTAQQPQQSYLVAESLFHENDLQVQVWQNTKTGGKQ